MTHAPRPESTVLAAAGSGGGAMPYAGNPTAMGFRPFGKYHIALRPCRATERLLAGCDQSLDFLRIARRERVGWQEGKLDAQQGEIVIVSEEAL